MVLEGKVAVIYGGGGSIGGAVARAYAGEGAQVFLAGRTQASLEAVAEEIRATGGNAQTAVLDALDEAAVDDHAARVAEQAGSLDISLNVITEPSVHGTPVHEMSVADYVGDVETMVRTQFLTMRAAARQMARQGSGLILCFGGDGPPIRDYFIGGTQTALAAVEAMRRQLAVELGPSGVRTATIRTGGIPESLPQEVRDANPEIEASMVEETTLGRAATLEDVGRAAVFLASADAGAITGATVNISAGALID